MGLLDNILTGKPLPTVCSSTPGTRPTQTKPAVPGRPLSTGSATGPSTTTKRKATSELAHTNTKSPRLAVANPITKDDASSKIKPTAPRPQGAKGSSATVKDRKPLSNQPALARPAAALPAKTPSKGSFLEIMARANNLKASTKDFRIVNKKLEKKPKESAKDRKKKELLGKDGSKRPLNSKDAKGQPRSSTKSGKDEKPARVRPEITYKGTERPVPGSGYQGTAGLKSSTKHGQTSSAKPGFKGQERSSRYRDYSDEEEDEEDEEENEYYSDASSDMEAGAFDLEQEEQDALRAGKREDAAAMREEEERKRRKLASKLGRRV